ncbi:uncharacterized protein LOC105219069 [Zeugodacus cucurbitae]|uniref:Lipoteichoic acid synthase 2 n=1 Tax=Zeugodacus cucurbitae TaxID=28588 RepID=A0A0A1XA01_ZEUCU|nr:uncharacterized protein LOC105219069 [Zeugodacus cucurbitae]
MAKIRYKLLNNNKEQTIQSKHIIIFCLIILILHLLYSQSVSDDINDVHYVDKNAKVHHKEKSQKSIKTTAATMQTAATSEAAATTTILTSTIAIAEQQQYFINTSQCRMPFVEPFEKGVLDLFNPVDYNYTNCTNDETFITVNYQLNTRQYFLHMDMEAMERTVKPLNASATDVRCCYRQIVRSGSGAGADENFDILPCTTFLQDFMVPQHVDYIITECSLGKDDPALIQKDAFSFVQEKNNSATNTSNKHTTAAHKKPNVFLLGIDSVSRINFRRTMPEIFKYLQMNNWYELQGYNKIADNTFPNLMAVLASYNLTTAEDKCRPTSVGGLNEPICNFIWNNFKNYGYKTAYAEDCNGMSTFNYVKRGFLQQPTDYYLRPMLMALTKNLEIVEKYGLDFCVGRKHQAEYIFDFLLQFANTFPADPLFGLFWVNSFSHNAFEGSALMEAKLLEYIKRMKRDGILERSIVILFSDHGMRWGSLFQFKSGFLEERLPAMFISIPSWYQNEHPDFMKNLQINQKRLTTPYDIYATMKHILEVGEPEKAFPYHNGTIQGISVFREIPEERNCDDASIPDHWCTCVPYETVDKNDDFIRNITTLVFNEMNLYLINKNISDKCSNLTLNSLSSADLKMYDAPNQSTYRLTFEALPKEPLFQATVIYNRNTKAITMNVEDISRLDSYESTARCINLKEAKKYCICKDIADE